MPATNRKVLQEHPDAYLVHKDDEPDWTEDDDPEYFIRTGCEGNYIIGSGNTPEEAWQNASKKG